MFCTNSEGLPEGLPDAPLDGLAPGIAETAQRRLKISCLISACTCLNLRLNASRASCYPWIVSASEKIGRYREIRTKATKIPMKIMIAGSIKLSAAVVRFATSSS
jgi:hypothetical protein